MKTYHYSGDIAGSFMALTILFAWFDWRETAVWYLACCAVFFLINAYKKEQDQ